MKLSMELNWVDIVILLICLIFFAIGYRRGLINQIFSIAALIGGIVCGFIFYDLGGNLLVNYEVVKNPSTAGVVGFITIVVIAYIVIQLVGLLLTKIVGTLRLGWLNRFVGGIIGVVIGVIVSFFLVSSFELLLDDNKSLKKSVVASHIVRGYSFLKSSVPRGLRDEYKNAKEVVEKRGTEEVLKRIESKEPKKSPNKK